MTQVIFTEKFDFHPKGEWRTIKAYEPSEEPQTVTRECAAKAIKAGAAKKYKAPSKAPKKGTDDAERSAKNTNQD